MRSGLCADGRAKPARERNTAEESDGEEPRCEPGPMRDGLDHANHGCEWLDSTDRTNGGAYESAAAHHFMCVTKEAYVVDQLVEPWKDPFSRTILPGLMQKTTLEPESQSVFAGCVPGSGFLR
jgi:hypothetical protein